MEIQQAGYVSEDLRHPELVPYYRIVCAFGMLRRPSGVLVRCPCSGFDAGELTTITDKLLGLDRPDSIIPALGRDGVSVEELNYSDRRLEWSQGSAAVDKTG